MKKLFTLSILFVITSSILISCKSSSVMKRRYNKGYYVHHAGKPTEPKTTEKITVNKKASALPSTEVIQAAPAIKESIAVNKTTAKNDVTANAVKKANVYKAPHNSSSLKTLPTEFSVQKPFKTIKNLNSKMSSGDSGDDALSLLWVIIVVLLIIYLLSFLFEGFGLGILIHLLAIIIVILLILWLLRLL